MDTPAADAAATPAPRPWIQAVRESAVAVVVFLFLSWAVTEGRLGWFSDTLADAQDQAYDALASLEYHFASPVAPPAGTPPVVFVDIDDDTVQAANISPYLFHRGVLADLLTRVAATQPRAVYVDLNLSAPSQEPVLDRRGTARFPRSAGDEALLTALRAPHAFPVLLSQPAVFGEPLSRFGAACWVTPAVITDSGDTVRRVPRRWADGPYPVSEALFQASQPGGFQCPDARRGSSPPRDVYRTALYGEPIVFHEVPTSGARTYAWPGLSVISARTVLAQDAPVLEPGALVVVGRTDADNLDMHGSAVGSLPGVELHLNALMTLLAYRHPVVALDPIASSLLAFAAMLLAILAAPLLSGLLTRGLTRLGVRRQVGDVFEHPIMWGLLFGAAFLAYRYAGRFLDFALPIVSLELARLALGRRLNQLATKTLKMAKLLN
ncbi:CHASE2 domain-containing sensor protein [Deinococcus metalli]|uniref:CHASE2 domain-containing sensor protein n=1 Tax=Deinococcus metalli TaxID=1141878 RepID=A0A7W8NR62_9DEIO|nr:CHASE2 domain-containing protein [Deinococcus metalli]MBB5376548.1 CHASE2 domain-containing sensor protein [Deinococcus metalli]